MVKVYNNESIMSTLATEQHGESVMINQTGIEAEITRDKIRDTSGYSPSSLDQTEEIVTDKAETKTSTDYHREFLQNEDSEKNRRARANALMDAQCLYYLKLFNKDKALYVEDLNECLEQTKDWLKISMLIRADYLEALDSTVRITPEGLTAWEQLNKFTHIRDTQQTSE